MTTTATPTVGATSQSWIRFLDKNRKQTAIGLFVAAGLMLLFPIWSGLHLGRDYLLVTIWAILPPLLTALAGQFVLMSRGDLAGHAGLWFMSLMARLVLGAVSGIYVIGGGPSLVPREGQLGERPLTDEERENLRLGSMRLIALSYGSLLGIWFILLSGYLVVFQWWDTVFAGGLEMWRHEGWKFGITLACFFVGLILIFASVQLAQAEQEKVAAMRRTLYGYNAILTGILLLAILVILNVLSYTQVWPYKLLAQPADWTEKSFYKLSDASVNLLKGLDRPVHIYVLQTEDAGRNDDIQHLFESCRALTDKIEVEYLSRDRNRREIDSLQGRYKEAAIGGSGLLVVYGPEGQQTAAFISEREMYPGGGMGSSVRFAGEDALMRWLSFLAEGHGGGSGENSLKIYVTQGNGEPSLTPQAAMGGMREESGLDVLASKLRDFHYQLAPLNLTDQTKEIPDDAELVLVLPSRRPLPAAGVTALRTYVTTENAKTKKKGKLLVLTKVQMNRQFKMFQTGIEPLLNDLGVEVSNDHILRIPEDLQKLPEDFRPTRAEINAFTGLLLLSLEVPVEANPASQNKIAQAFAADTGTGRRLKMEDVREVHGLQKPGAYQAEEIFRTTGAVWNEADLIPDNVPARTYRWWFENRAAFQQSVMKDQLPVAVAVTERSTAPGSSATPRMIVFGNSSWISNGRLSESETGIEFDLFRSCVSWLRERPDVGSWTNAKERPGFGLPSTTLEERAAITRLYWLPALMIGLAIVGFGGFVWLARRR